MVNDSENVRDNLEGLNCTEICNACDLEVEFVLKVIQIQLDYLQKRTAFDYREMSGSALDLKERSVEVSCGNIIDGCNDIIECIKFRTEQTKQIMKKRNKE